MQAPLIAAGVVTLIAGVSAVLTLPPAPREGLHPPPQDPARFRPHNPAAAAATGDAHAASGEPGGGGAEHAVLASVDAQVEALDLGSHAVPRDAEPAATAATPAATVVQPRPGGRSSNGGFEGAPAASAAAASGASPAAARSALVSRARRDPAVLLLLASTLILQISGSGFTVRTTSLHPLA